MFGKKIKADELDLLAEKERALRDEMQRLESYIKGGAEQERADHINTMPAPDDLNERRRQASFVDQVMSKKEIRNVKRQQAKATILFLMLLLAIVSLGSWVVRAYSDYAASI